ncbi:MAG: hypothetical protein R3C18_05390 [Planctomycetaceae bacterium]
MANQFRLLLRAVALHLIIRLRRTFPEASSAATALFPAFHFEFAQETSPGSTGHMASTHDQSRRRGDGQLPQRVDPAEFRLARLTHLEGRSPNPPAPLTSSPPRTRPINGEEADPRITQTIPHLPQHLTPQIHLMNNPG